ncbi:MAG TPA: MBL fold metallo-hydrolase [Polyangia bacterium]|nr:MBL fold metallo-hydrolase [Polyangia bacterium]
MASSKIRHELRRARDAVELALFTGAPAAGDEVRRALAKLAAENGSAETARIDELARLAEGRGDRAAYRDRFGVAGVRRFETAGGAAIYLLAVETFPDHVNNIYLVRDHGRVTLYDCGSQTPSTQEELRRAALILKQVFAERAGFDDVSDVVISHAHIDHFGGVGAWHGRARIWAHEFDARVVSRFEERIVTVAMQLRVFLERAGLDAPTRAELEQMYVFTKQLFISVPVDRAIADGAEVNGFPVHHAPGHCPGQICLQVHNVLLTADHVLPRITPHQSPESITPWTGLDHYLLSLEKFRRIGGVDLALPGHEEPIPRLAQRIVEIETFHRARLEKVRALCAEPKTIAELAEALFGEQRGYGRLLALEEAAAHAEYLARRGALEMANLEEMMHAANPVVRYRAARVQLS